MIRLKTDTWFAALLGALFVCAGSARAADIGGAISTTLTITENSQLVDDVTCTVTGTACIAIGAPHVTLELNGFTITGQGNSQTACNGGPSTFVEGSTEDGIYVRTQTDVTIRGPGLIQRFRGCRYLLKQQQRHRGDRRDRINQLPLRHPGRRRIRTRPQGQRFGTKWEW